MIKSEKTTEEHYGDILDQVIAFCAPFFSSREMKITGRREVPAALQELLQLVLDRLDPAMLEYEIRELREYFVRSLHALEQGSKPATRVNSLLPTPTDTGWYNFADGSSIQPARNSQPIKWLATLPERVAIIDMQKNGEPRLFNSPEAAAAALAAEEAGPAAVRLSAEQQQLWAVLQMESYSVRGLLSSMVMPYSLRAQALRAAVNDLRRTATQLEAIAYEFTQASNCAARIAQGGIEATDNTNCPD